MKRRPALNELMNDARKRKFAVVLVGRFDRFARSTKHLILALEAGRLGSVPVWTGGVYVRIPVRRVDQLTPEE